MTRNSTIPLIISDGYWMHIRHLQVRHHRYPQFRGEGLSIAEAMRDLINELIRGRDFVHGREREDLERAVSEARAFQPPRPRIRAALSVPVSVQRNRAPVDDAEISKRFGKAPGI